MINYLKYILVLNIPKFNQVRYAQPPDLERIKIKMLVKLREFCVYSAATFLLKKSYQFKTVKPQKILRFL